MVANTRCLRQWWHPAERLRWLLLLHLHHQHSGHPSLSCHTQEVLLMSLCHLLQSQEPLLLLRVPPPAAGGL
jgi:hypothetical protein